MGERRGRGKGERYVRKGERRREEVEEGMIGRTREEERGRMKGIDEKKSREGRRKNIDQKVRVKIQKERKKKNEDRTRRGGEKNRRRNGREIPQIFFFPSFSTYS